MVKAKESAKLACILTVYQYDCEFECYSNFLFSCSPGGVRIMTLLAYLSSQPAVKVSLLQLLKTRSVSWT